MITNNKQQLFDTMLTHLRQQGCRAKAETGGCAYRGYSGTKCAVGCLIEDHQYDPQLEGKGIHAGMMAQLGWPRDVEPFLRAAQVYMHDTCSDSNFSADLECGAQSLAIQFGLEYSPCATS